MSTIPDDILAQVFEAACKLPDLPAKQPMNFGAYDTLFVSSAGMPLRIQSVSKRFCNLARHLSGLWTTLTDLMSPECAAVYLERSRQKPLAIGVKLNGGDEDVRAYLVAVLAHKDRWEALYVVLPDGHVENDLFPFTGNQAFPMLRTVHIVGELGYAAGEAIVLDQDLFISYWHAPCLETATLRNVMPHGPVVAALTSLDVHLRDPCIYPVRLWLPLAACRSLSSLRVSAEHWVRYMGRDFDANVMEGPPLVLESVRTFSLSLRLMACHDATSLFRSFQFPQLQSLALSVTSATDTNPMELYLQQLLAPGAVGRVATLERLSLRFMDWRMFCARGAPTPVEVVLRTCAFPKLTHLVFAHPVFRLNRSVDRPVMTRLLHFPPSLAVLDMSGVLTVHSDGLKQLIVRLGQCRSHATVLVCSESLRLGKLPSHEVQETIVSFCARRASRGQMEFGIQWLDSIEDTLQ